MYFTAQRTGKLGILDAKTGKVEEVPLGQGSAPGWRDRRARRCAWITDSGQNAIVRVDPKRVKCAAGRYPRIPLMRISTPPRSTSAAVSGLPDKTDSTDGSILRPTTWRCGKPRAVAGRTASRPRRVGEVYYASLAGNHIARIDVETGEATVIEPPTPAQGARRVWSDSRGHIWVSYWNTGQVGMYDPATHAWREWKLPGGEPHAYSVWVDDQDKVWLTEWSANAIVKFDPVTQKFESFPSNRENASVRQMLGRAGEAWGAESEADRSVMVPAR